MAPKKVMYRMTVIGATLRNVECREDKKTPTPHVPGRSHQPRKVEAVHGELHRLVAIITPQPAPAGKRGASRTVIRGRSAGGRPEAAREVLDELLRRPAAAGAGGERPTQRLFP